MLPSLEALAVLDAIDRRGSFAAAADELGRVPSAVTYTVRRLEETLDVLLFDRRGHRARLTPAGRELLAAGRQLLEDAERAAQRVRRVATGWESELAIAIGAIACDLELELAEPHYVERSVRRNITMGPAHGVRVRVLGARPAARETTHIAAAS